MQRQLPRPRPSLLASASVQIKQQPHRPPPLQHDALIFKPGFGVARERGVDEVGREEGVQAREEEGEVGEARKVEQVGGRGGVGAGGGGGEGDLEREGGGLDEALEVGGHFWWGY